MKSADRQGFPGICWALVVAMLVISANLTAVAQQEIILYAFNGAPDGDFPDGALVADAPGNLYGTTVMGGTYSHGTVFKLTPPSTLGGVWAETILYSFGTTSTDGQQPEGNLLMDAKGNLFGTTGFGGTLRGGTVFELSPPAISGNPWTLTTLHNFPLVGNNLGSAPCGLLPGKNGQLFGSTIGGGLGYGSVYVLSPPLRPRGSWTARTLYTFASATDGYDLVPGCGPLVADAKGNLYGTTGLGGSGEAGTVFELSPPPHYVGSWIKTVLYNFAEGNIDGYFPWGGLTFDVSGNLFGTTASGGPANKGTIFELTPVGNGSWNESLPYTFGTTSTDGAQPQSTVIFDASGNMYGTAGTVVWKLSPPSSSGGAWTQTVLHIFTNSPDGAGPDTGVILGPGGALYGVTAFGGIQSTGGSGYGTVYEVIP